MSDVLVVGGGVIGLLSALELAHAGLHVRVLDTGVVGRESSWAGGGIVSPLYPWRYNAAVNALAHWSQGFYPRLAEHLKAVTGIDPELYTTGLYWLNLEDEVDALAWATGLGRPLQGVPIAAVREAVPALAEGFSRALHMPDVANVRNPRLVTALRAVLESLPNVTLYEYRGVEGFLREGARVCGVRTAVGELRAGRVLLAAGAWSGELLSTLGMVLPVEPVKGQMILYKCASDFLQAMVLADGRYAIPRRDGHVLFGSTLERAGFDKTPTAEAVVSLRASAATLLPALAEAEPIAHWAGLRPGSPDGIPFIGELDNCPGLWLNCGHYRNGLVLAPASCTLLRNLMLGETPIVDPAPYTPSVRVMPA